MIIIISVFLATIIIAILKGIGKNKKQYRENRLNSILKDTDCFSPSLTVTHCDSQYLISFDDDGRKILYATANEEIKYVFEYTNVISVELIEDSTTIFSKSTSRTIGGGIVGGIIGGGVGAIIGGLSGDSKGEKTVREVKIKILLRNYQKSAIYIDCLAFDFEVKRDCDYYKTIIDEARKIVDKLSVIIDLVERDEKSKQKTLANSPSSLTSSIADELEKIYGLKEKGIISVEEHDKLKAKLLQ